MNSNLQKTYENFMKLGLRERVLIVAAIALVIYLIMDLTLLTPQQKKIKQLEQLDNQHKNELVIVNNALADIRKNSPSGANLTPEAIEAIKKQIAEADALFGEIDTSSSQTGTLVRKILASNPSLTLLSLNTLPTVPFYTIENKPKPGENPNQVAPPKVIYSYGVEISIKGNYLALLSYMNSLRKFPKRLLWSNTNVDVDTYPDAVLKMSVYSLSAQPSSPIH